MGKDKRYLRNNFTPCFTDSFSLWDYYEFTGDEEFFERKGIYVYEESFSFLFRQVEWDEEKNEYFFESFCMSRPLSLM